MNSLLSFYTFDVSVNGSLPHGDTLCMLSYEPPMELQEDGQGDAQEDQEDGHDDAQEDQEDGQEEEGRKEEEGGSQEGQPPARPRPAPSATRPASSPAYPPGRLPRASRLALSGRCPASLRISRPARSATTPA